MVSNFGLRACRNATIESATASVVAPYAYPFKNRRSPAMGTPSRKCGERLTSWRCSAVVPGVGARAAGRIPGDLRRHRAQHLAGCRWADAVALHGPAILERGLGARTGRGIKECLRLVDGHVEVEVVHVAGVEVQLADELRTDRRPVRLHVRGEIEAVVAHVLGDAVIDRAGSFVPQRLGISILAHRTVHCFPRFLLLGRSAVRTKHGLELAQLALG